MSFYSGSAYKVAMNPSRSGIAVVTGGKCGIGKALAIKIASFPFIDQVIAVSRSINASDVEEHAKISALAADVGTQEGRAMIVDTVDRLCANKTKQLRFLIHSAGIIDPIKSVLEVKPEELRRAMNVNCEAPFFLTIALYPHMCDDTTPGRVLHVSSGAAHGAPPVGWACYGITKAAFFQSFKVLEREFRQALGGKVVVGSFKPGVVDTAMQGTIRSSPDKDMPIVQVFKNMKAQADIGKVGTVPKARPPPEGALDTPENVAFFAEFLLLGTTDEEYGNANDSSEWDIRNASLFERWIPQENMPQEN